MAGFEEGMRRVLEVEDLAFEAGTFMKQVASAFTSGSAMVRDLRTKEEVTIRRLQSSDWDAIDLELPSQRKVHRWRNRLWGVLLESPNERELVLRRHARLFDLDAGELERLLQSLYALEDPLERFERAAAVARCSLPFFYDGLEQRIRSNEPLTETDLMPNAGLAFFGYYGLYRDSVRDAATSIASEAVNLETRVGPIAATARLAALPVPLPAITESAFCSAAADRQEESLHAVLRAGPSPIHRIQALRLAFMAESTPAMLRLRRWLLRQHLSCAARDERAAFCCMLTWVSDVVDNWHEARRWDRSFRLAFSWAHASNLFAMYRRSRAPLGWIAEVFQRPRGYQSITDLEEDFVRGRDVADPDAVAETIAVSGLAYALSPNAMPLPAEIAMEVKRQWFTDPGWPHAWFLEIPGSRPNALSSFLGRDQLGDLRSLLGEELAGEWDTGWRTRLEQQTLMAVRSESRGSTDWILLAALYGTGPAPVEAASQIEDAFMSLELCNLVESNRTNQEPLFFAIANRLAHVTGLETRAALTSALIRLAEWYGSHDGTDDEASGLLNLVLALAYPTRYAGKALHLGAIPAALSERREDVSEVCWTVPVHG